jgi:hypothetical protein
MGTPNRPYPAALEQVVARALAPDRDDRWPDVRSYVEALTAAAAGQAVPGAPVRELRDPELTAVGARPSPKPTKQPTKQPTGQPTGPTDADHARGGGPVRRRRWALVTAGFLALMIGAGTAYTLEQRAERLVTVTDAQGTISVEVPRSWETVVSGDGWTPPGETVAYPAISIGGEGDAPGVFVGVLPGQQLPQELPGHPECSEADSAVHDRFDGDRSVTVVHSGCPDVIVERVIRVTANRLLWVQVRSHDRATANNVLDTVTTHGM